MSLPDEIADRLLQAVLEGQFPADSPLPPEGELALSHGVSRLTVREAVRILRSKNVVEIRRGRGTFVTPPERWTSLDALVQVYAKQGSGISVEDKLLEARRMVEVGAAQLAAVHRTKEDLAQLESCIAEMRAGNERNDLDLFVEADIAFHDLIMRASGNIFVPFMFEPFGELLVQARRQTSAVPAVQQHAIAEHEHILECLVAGDADRCRAAMESHMSQTQTDLRNILSSAREPTF
jgi:GntR family transcriptional regulator, transcriptional repressor for pyruvate dehydrogenase complex